ncbi:MAG TPA: universal stress protein [Candidatus Sphingobacterium stercorigallinarum]|nr:universal stress protein [Candidatus Sphingobacterium stercorigallinarum]
MNKTIIVPTDFSPNAERACYYAAQIAEVTGYDMHLLHCYTVNSVGGNGTDAPQEKSTNLADEQIQDLRQTLLKKNPSIHITWECARGLIIDKLSALSNTGKFAIIIMGASGASQSKSLYWGSATVAVASKSAVPVIVVPDGDFNFSLRKAALLTNFKAEELDTLREFQNLLGPPQQLTIVHVFQEQKHSLINDTLDSWAYNIREMGSIEQVDTFAEHLQPGDEDLDTIPEIVGKAVEELNPDLILITPSRKTFFQRLFKPSVSKAIALELKKPAFFDKI